MAFLESKMVMGYYRTPDRVVEQVARMVVAPDPGGRYHLLDPCCGEGLALADLHRHIGAGATHGIELDVARSDAAATRLDKVLGAGYEQCRVSTGETGAELLWLNPPYDGDETKAGRLELTFLRETQDWLRPGGLLVYIVRQPHLTHFVAQRLAAWFGDLAAYRFPDPEYGTFQQVVILGVKRPAPVEDRAAYQMLLAAGKGYPLPPLPEAPERRYPLPARDPAAAWQFRLAQAPPGEMSAEAQRAGVWATRAWQDAHMSRPTVPAYAGTGRPLMPLRMLHIALYIAAGLVDNALLDDGAERLVVKGHSTKVTLDVTTPEEREQGVQRIQEQLRSAVWQLDLKRATFRRIDEQKDFYAFVERWRETLVARIQQAYPPLHRLGEIAPWQAQALAGLLTGKRLPGRRESGLLPVQQEVAVAAYKSIVCHGVASLIMATGTGKTATSLAVARLLQVEHLRRGSGRPFGVLVMTEEHLPAQWVQEVRATVPMSYVAVAERVSDVRTFVRAAQQLDARTLCVLIVPKSMAKLGTGWTGAAIATRRDGVLRCPTCGQPVCSPDEEGNPILPVGDPAWLDEKKRRCLAIVPRAVRGAIVPRESGGASDPLSSEPVRCDAPLWQDVREKNGRPWYPTAGRSLGWLTQVQRAVREGTWCDLIAPDPPPPRYAIADYVERRLKGFFGLFVADEAHRYNGDYTDQAYAYRALARAVGRTLELTATAFNGKASSLFARQYVQLPVLRQAYGWRDKAVFVGHYGLQETVRKREVGEEPDEVGVYSGKARYQERTRELPGLMPALLPLLLPTHVFLQLDDLGALLPAYVHAGRTLACPADIEREYRQFNDACTEALRQYPTIAGAWLQAALAYPNSPWHTERVTAIESERGRSPRMRGSGVVEVACAPALWDVRSAALLPKEAWLLEYVQRQVAQGRGVGVYVAHVHERGLPERLAWLLDQAGVRACVLPGTLSARRRNEWIKRQWGQGMRVLITHPGKVETGLNLLDFPSLVFYQPGYTLATHIQAAGRAWRLGQRQDCEVLFPYYAGTLEHRALALMDRKVKANAILTGNEEMAAVSGEEAAAAGASFVAELTREALRGAAVEDLGVMLRREQRDAWTEEEVILAEERTARGLRRRVEAVSGVQAGLFDMPLARQLGEPLPEVSPVAPADIICLASDALTWTQGILQAETVFRLGVAVPLPVAPDAPANGKPRAGGQLRLW